MQLVYLAVNKINNKIYIGKTKRGIHIRVLEHFRSAKRGSTTAFHSAIRKYGEDAFSWSIIHDNIDDSLIDDQERYWIARYKALGYTLYNLTDGGDGGPNFKGKHHTEQSRKLIGNRKPRTEEWKKNNGKLVKSRAKTVTLYKDGVYEKVINVVDWCKEHGYGYPLVYSMIRGARKSAYGWRIVIDRNT